MDQPLLTAGQLLAALPAYWWTLCRILALLATAPPFHQRGLPLRLRILLGLALTVALSPSLPPPPAIAPLSLAGVLATIEQVTVGALLGLSLQLVFVAYTVVASTVSAPMGLSMALAGDPVNGVSSAPLLYQLYFLLLILVFFAMDGHLVTVSVLYQSFVYWPVGGGLPFAGLASFVYAFAWVLSAAALIATPVVFGLLLVQFGFGLLNRISPAMNLFSLGFPMAVVSGLSLILLSVPNLADAYLELTRDLLHALGLMLRGDADG